MKVFITGIGSDLGTQIARSLETHPDIEDIAGADMFPPRRYLARTKFFMTHFDDSERISYVVERFDPDVIVNFGVFEPGARLNFSRARSATNATVTGIISAVEKIKRNKLVHVISRSSVVSYGFEDPTKVYDETSPMSPDTPYGKMCRDVEEKLRSRVAHLTIIRTAPELGAHVPHPLARLLNLPAIPIELRLPSSRDVGFPIISPRDVVDIFVRVVGLDMQDNKWHRILHGACATNATMLMASRIGKKIPIPTAGIGFSIGKRISYIAGAPMDPHIEMLIRRGMVVDSTATRMFLGITSQDSPSEILKNMYQGEEKSIDSSTLPGVKQ